MKNYYNLHFATTPSNQFFPTKAHTYVASKLRTTSSKFSLMINLTFVQHFFKTLLIILQHFQKETLVTLKYQLQIKNQNTIGLMT